MSMAWCRVCGEQGQMVWDWCEGLKRRVRGAGKGMGAQGEGRRVRDGNAGRGAGAQGEGCRARGWSAG